MNQIAVHVRSAVKPRFIKHGFARNGCFHDIKERVLRTQLKLSSLPPSQSRFQIYVAFFSRKMATDWSLKWQTVPCARLQSAKTTASNSILKLKYRSCL